MQIKRARSLPGVGRLPLARRTILHYAATCRDCEELPANPRKATAHATAKKHRVTESRHYLVELDET